MPQTDCTRREGKIDGQAKAGQKLGECKVKRIYIAGPMTGVDGMNEREFMKAELVLNCKKEFEMVYSPSGMADTFCWDENTDLRTIAKVLLEALTRCTHIYMLRGWEQSKGARAEHAVAVWVGLEIIYQGGEG